MLNARALKEFGGQGEGREETKSTARFSPNWFPSKQSPTTLLSCFGERLENAGIPKQLALLTLQIDSCAASTDFQLKQILETTQ